jgi:hypothetical protein
MSNSSITQESEATAAALLSGGETVLVPAVEVTEKPPRLYTKTILLLALLSRLCMLWFVLTHYARRWLYTRAELGTTARHLALGQGFHSPFGGNTGPTAFMAPGYPFVVSIVFRIFGIFTQQSMVVVLLMHIAFGVATVALVVYIARRTVGVRAANIAGTWWALSAVLVWLPAIFWDTSLSVLLLTGMVALALYMTGSLTNSGAPCLALETWALLRPWKSVPSNSKNGPLLLWAIAGFYCGLILLINPSLVLALLGILGWIAFQAWGKPDARYGVLVALVIMLAVFAPWPVRNARVFHAFIPFRSNLGFELWDGNQPGQNGEFIESLHPVVNETEFRKYSAMGEVAYMRDKGVAAKANIGAHRLEFLRVTAWRVQAFWFGLALGPLGNSGLVIFHSVIGSCLGLLGLVLMFRRNTRLAWLFALPLVLFPLPYYITHPDFRFRVLLDPLITVLAAYAVVVVWSYVKDMRIKKTLLPSETPHAPHVWH